MKKTVSLNKNFLFRKVYAKGTSIPSNFCVLYAKRNGNDFNRLGITVTKKLGKATVRNRIRRLIYESYRMIEDKLKVGYDIVIVARMNSVGKSYTDILKSVNYTVKKAGLLNEENLHSVD